MSTPVTPPSSEVPGGHFRISDEDRELVTTVLTTAYAEGRITREEFDERTGQVLASKTFNDLAPITADLMPTTQVQQYTSPPPAVRAEPGPDQLVVVDPSHVASDSDSLFGILGTARRDSPGWRMHRKTSVLVGLGDAIIDLTQGVMEDPHVEIEVMVGLGDLKVIVPAGVQVIDRVSNIMGESKVVGTRPPVAGGPTITITGVTFMGEVKVIGPDHKSFISLVKKSARRALKQSRS
ncbi:DUF1707 SHOCT-like domain-containing protein [Aestuariimicrobium soli]|uniref:DUF1707 SHOCT-like domain-containing protein n=1 Tax=Aestuariimicrobium soli TaxID=2035834 RepID=UPI003EBDA381